MPRYKQQTPPKRGLCVRGIRLLLAAREAESSEAEAEKCERGGFRDQTFMAIDRPRSNLHCVIECEDRAGHGK
jgi:hypothetical protein